MNPSEVLRRAKELYGAGKALSLRIALWEAAGRNDSRYMAAVDFWDKVPFTNAERFDRAIALAEAEEK